MMPDDDSPLLLASAGIGCTPMIGMLNHLVDTGAERSVSVIHADRSIADHAHRAELSTLVDQIPAATLHRWYEDLGTHVAFGSVHEGRADLQGIAVEPDTQAFLCGPMPFMLAMRASLLERDVPPQNIPLRGLRTGQLGPIPERSRHDGRPTGGNSFAVVGFGSDVACSTAAPPHRSRSHYGAADGGEEVERLTSSDPDLLEWIGDRVSSED